MPKRELSKVAQRERRLAMGDGIQGNRRIGNDLVTILARDPHMIVGTFGVLTVHGASRPRRADLVLRFKRDALRFQCPVIDASIKAKFRHADIDMSRPSRAPFFQ